MWPFSSLYSYVVVGQSQLTCLTASQCHRKQQKPGNLLFSMCLFSKCQIQILFRFRSFFSHYLTPTICKVSSTLPHNISSTSPHNISSDLCYSPPRAGRSSNHSPSKSWMCLLPLLPAITLSPASPFSTPQPATQPGPPVLSSCLFPSVL